MAYVKADTWVLQQIAATGLPLVGGSVSAYITGTTTPLAMYTDSAGGGSATSFTLNSLGMPQSAGGTAVDIYLDDAHIYKFIVRDAEGTAVPPTIDPVYPGGGNGLTGTMTSMEALRASSVSVDYIETVAFYEDGTTGGAKLYRDGTGTPTGSGTAVIAAALAAGTFCNAAGVCYKLSKDIAITPYMFGVLADNATNDWPAAKLAFDYAKAFSKRLVFDGSKTYYLGQFPNSGAEYKFHVDVDGLRVETNGCTFRVDISTDVSHAANWDQTIFQIEDASDTWIGDFTITADQVITSPSRIGVIGVHLRNIAASTKNLTLGNITGNEVMCAFQATTSDSSLYRHSGIRSGVIHTNDSYYSVNFAENGDDYTGFTASSDNTIRTYYVYGVDNHQGLVTSVNHPSVNDVLIQRRVRDTSNIDIAYRCRSDNSTVESVAIQFVTDDTDAVINNVTIKLDADKTTTSSRLISFRAFDGSSTPLTTTTNQFNNINLSGRTNVQDASRLVLDVGMTGAARSTVYATPEIWGRKADTKGFIFPRGTAQIATADINTDLLLDFKIRDVASASPQMARLSVTAFDNATAGVAEYIARDFWVLFQMSNDGSITVIGNSTIATYTAGALGPTITIGNQPAGTCSLKVKVNNYTNANRFAKGILELFAFKES